MTDIEVSESVAVDGARPAGEASRPVDDRAVAAGIDPDDEHAVPAALTALIEAARHASIAMDVNGIYPAQVAVEAVEDVVAALERMTTHVIAYAGDYSKRAQKGLTRTVELLGDAPLRTERRPRPPAAGRAAVRLRERRGRSVGRRAPHQTGHVDRPSRHGPPVTARTRRGVVVKAGRCTR
jgi:hypothetical protein